MFTLPNEYFLFQREVLCDKQFLDKLNIGKYLAICTIDHEDAYSTMTEIANLYATTFDFYKASFLCEESNSMERGYIAAFRQYIRFDVCKLINSNIDMFWIEKIPSSARLIFVADNNY